MTATRNRTGKSAAPPARAAAPLPAAATLEGPQRFYNRELSWLRFNRRVLEEAENNGHPLLERLRFLSISASNLDEFYMVRVAGLIGQVGAGVATLSQDGLSPAQQLVEINQAASALIGDQQACWTALKGDLASAGLHIIEPKALREHERAWLEKEFLTHNFPVLTPIAVDPAHPFPFINNKGLSLGVDLAHETDGRSMHALLPVPAQLDRFLRLPPAAREPDGAADIRFMRIETVIGLFISRLFPGFKIRSQGAFRVIRDSDLEIQEEAEDLVRLFESALKRRRRGDVIRLEIDGRMPPAL